MRADEIVAKSRLLSQTHRNPIVFDLVFPAELVGQLFPGGGDVVGALLRRLLASERLLQFILGNAIIWKMPGMRGSIAELGWL